MRQLLRRVVSAGFLRFAAALHSFVLALRLLADWLRRAAAFANFMAEVSTLAVAMFIGLPALLGGACYIATRQPHLQRAYWQAVPRNLAAFDKARECRRVPAYRVSWVALRAAHAEIEALVEVQRALHHGAIAAAESGATAIARSLLSEMKRVGDSVELLVLERAAHLKTLEAIRDARPQITLGLIWNVAAAAAQDPWGTWDPCARSDPGEDA